MTGETYGAGLSNSKRIAFVGANPEYEQEFVVIGDHQLVFTGKMMWRFGSTR